jgi:hypothetical protein
MMHNTKGVLFILSVCESQFNRPNITAIILHVKLLWFTVRIWAYQKMSLRLVFDMACGVL